MVCIQCIIIQVAPDYKIALEALFNENGNDVVEMAGYASPPEQVVAVANCLCPTLYVSVTPTVYHVMYTPTPSGGQTESYCY